MARSDDSIAVVGAGLTGLVAALRLAEGGRTVEVFERWPAAGGLVSTFEVGGEPLECFYHHIFTTDTAYVALARELGLGDEIEWLPSRMGIWADERLWDFGTPLSLLRFGPLPWTAKVRFAASTLVLRHRDRLEAFEDVTAKEWILRHAGRRVWETVWGPLMEQKFAERAGDVSMAWLWRKVFLRGRSRSSGGLGERLGYMRGGFGRTIEALVDRLSARGVDIHVAAPVRSISPAEGRLRLTAGRTEREFGRVLFTGSPAELVRAAGDALPEPGRSRLASLPATAALCTVLELDRPLTPYYWVNIADPAFPFGGVIEHTNLVTPDRYGGAHVVYLSNYVFSDHPLWSARDDEVWARYRPFLARLAPAFSESWVRRRHLFRAAYAQPVIPTGYSRLLPPFETPVPGLFHACMAQVYPEDRGQNFAVLAGERAAGRLA